mgnify:CR=1 FL=1
MDNRTRDQAPGNADILARGPASDDSPEPGRRRREQPIDKAKVSAALQELAAEHARSPRSQTARLREVLDDVEAALTAGASHAAVLATLQAQGFTFTLRSFESTLGRLRKDRQTQGAELKSHRRSTKGSTLT